MYGLLLFLPTLALVPHASFFLPLIYSLLMTKGYVWKMKRDYMVIDRNLLIILLIIICCFLNLYFHIEKTTSVFEYIPYTLLMLLSFFYSNQVKSSHLKFLVYLITFESIVVIIEYFLGVKTIIPQLSELNEVASEGKEIVMLYDTRPLGLSNNSSSIAYKILLAILLIDFLRLKERIFFFARIILIIAIVLTFNRTVLIFVLLYFIMKIARPVLKSIVDFIYLKVKEKNKVIIGFGFVGFIAVIGLSVSYSDLIFSQFTRDKGIAGLLSGRDEIWADFWKFIQSNLFFGNGSSKFLVDYYSGPIHAHNSFLQIIANHGILISLLFLFLLFSNIKRRNFIYVITLIFYSLLQYGIFWGISLIDIVLFVFLFRLDLNEEQQDCSLKTEQLE